MPVSVDPFEDEIKITAQLKLKLCEEEEGLIRTDEVFEDVKLKFSKYSLDLLTSEEDPVEDGPYRDLVNEQVYEIVEKSLKEFRTNIWPYREGRHQRITLSARFFEFEQVWNHLRDFCRKEKICSQEALLVEVPLESICRLRLLQKIDAESQQLSDRFKAKVQEVYQQSLLEDE